MKMGKELGVDYNTSAKLENGNSIFAILNQETAKRHDAVLCSIFGNSKYIRKINDLFGVLKKF